MSRAHGPSIEQGSDICGEAHMSWSVLMQSETVNSVITGMFRTAGAHVAVWHPAAIFGFALAPESFDSAIGGRVTLAQFGLPDGIARIRAAKVAADGSGVSVVYEVLTELRRLAVRRPRLGGCLRTCSTQLADTLADFAAGMLKLLADNLDPAPGRRPNVRD
jgi:hypothetical protein